MNQGKYIFAQLSEFLPQRMYDRLVDKYNGNKYVKHFSCWNQLLCMVFGQRYSVLLIGNSKVVKKSNMFGL